MSFYIVLGIRNYIVETKGCCEHSRSVVVMYLFTSCIISLVNNYLYLTEGTIRVLTDCRFGLC